MPEERRVQPEEGVEESGQSGQSDDQFTAEKGGTEKPSMRVSGVESH